MGEGQQKVPPAGAAARVVAEGTEGIDRSDPPSCTIALGSCSGRRQAGQSSSGESGSREVTYSQNDPSSVKGFGA